MHIRVPPLYKVVASSRHFVRRLIVLPYTLGDIGHANAESRYLFANGMTWNTLQKIFIPGQCPLCLPIWMHDATLLFSKM
jgi:hypothetical protein